MANIMCMTEGHGPATFVGTFFPDGSGVRLCDECMPNFCAAVFERMTGVDMSPALYLASEEGQDGLPEPEGNPQEVAAPSTATPPGGSTDEPPPPAPHDADMEAADPTTTSRKDSGDSAGPSAEPGDPTAGIALSQDDASAQTQVPASNTTASSEDESPPSEPDHTEAVA